MTLSVLPALSGIAYPVKRSPNWPTVKNDSLNNKRSRFPLAAYPTYDYEAKYDFLRSNGGFTELQTLLGFINSVQGPAVPWLYTDPDDSAVTAQEFGVGDGVTTAGFQLCRTLGGFTEPVFMINGAPSIYVNGVLKTLTTDYTISAYGVVTFTVAPPLGQALTWTGFYYWMCRFDDDVTQFVKEMSTYYSVSTLKFSTEKLP